MAFLLDLLMGVLGTVLWLMAAAAVVLLGAPIEGTGEGIAGLVSTLALLAPLGVLTVAALSGARREMGRGARLRRFGVCAAGALMGVAALLVLLFTGAELTDSFPGENYLFRHLFLMSALPAFLSLPALGASLARRVQFSLSR